MRQQRDRLSLALAAVTCGRLTHAASARAIRGRLSAHADQYGVRVLESPPPPQGRRRRRRAPELVLEHWGGDAEMLALGTPLRSLERRADPGERARIAARTIRDHDLDALEIVYSDGTELTADRFGLVLRGPRQGRLRRRTRMIRAGLDELL